MTTQQDELLALLTLIYVEVMEYPPVQPVSADSYLPERFHALIRGRLESASGLPIEDVVRAVLKPKP